MDSIYKQIFFEWLEFNDEAPFEIHGIKDNGKLDVSFNDDFLVDFNYKIKNYPELSSEDFIKKLIKMHMKES